jgi:hypothetical protein
MVSLLQVLQARRGEHQEGVYRYLLEITGHYIGWRAVLQNTARFVFEHGTHSFLMTHVMFANNTREVGEVHV